MSKRIHELAKEWSVAPKDLLSGVEKVGIVTDGMRKAGGASTGSN